MLFQLGSRPTASRVDLQPRAYTWSWYVPRLGPLKPDTIVVGRLGEGQPGWPGGSLTSKPTWSNTFGVFHHVGFF